MKILVLGGAGYIGSILCPFLSENGHDVTILDNMLYEKRERVFAPCRFVKGDIRNIADIKDEIKKTDAVVNLAALSNDPASDLDPQLALDINYHSNKGIAVLCEKYKKRVIYASSCSVYGFDEKKVFNEDSKLGPVTMYAETKLLSERLYRKKGIDSIVLRFATVYGYSAKPRFDLVVNTMIGSGFFNKKITVNGGSQWRPLVHVKDIAKAILKAAEIKNPSFRVFNIGSNEQNFQISDLASIIGANMPGVSVESNADSTDKRSYRVDFSRAKEHLGFETTYTIQDAVNEFLRAFRNKEVTSMDEDVYYRVKYLQNNKILDKLPLDSKSKKVLYA